MLWTQWTLDQHTHSHTHTDGTVWWSALNVIWSGICFSPPAEPVPRTFWEAAETVRTGQVTSGWLFLEKKKNSRKRENVFGLLFLFLFYFMSENNTEIYAQACQCDWTRRRDALTMLREQKHHRAFEEQKKKKQKKRSILLPDILMFNMRVLYYHDYDYSCAILVYCCLNVTLFFYDMVRSKKLRRTMAVL